MKRTNYVLYTNDIRKANEEDYRESWEDYLECNELSKEELSLDEYINESLYINWEDFKDNMKYCSCDGECVILGSLGLWHGCRDIEPERTSNIMDAINKCIGRNGEYITIMKKNGHIELQIIHHDGSNNFEIHLLNDKGINAGYNADLNNRVYHSAMPEYLFS